MRFSVDEAGRVDRALAAAWGGAGRTLVARAFADGRVRVNGRRAKKGDRVLPGDFIEVAGDLGAALVPEPGELMTLFVDEHLVAVDKPAGMASHPLVPGETGTLANRLVAAYPECASAGADAREAGLVHRLDAGTSGVLPRGALAERRGPWSRAAFGERRVQKEYLALVVGPVSHAGEIDEPIAQVQGGRVAAVCADPDEAARRGAREARTTWEPVERFGEFTLLRCRAETGRMHQIRAHLAHVGTPIVGDSLYGIAVAGAPTLPAGFFLHSAALALAHPHDRGELADRGALAGGMARGAAGGSLTFSRREAMTGEGWRVGHWQVSVPVLRAQNCALVSGQPCAWSKIPDNPMSAGVAAKSARNSPFTSVVSTV